MIQSVAEDISAGTDSQWRLLRTGNNAASCQFNIHTDELLHTAKNSDTGYS